MSLTTHVLDTARGGGAAGMRVVVRLNDEECADVRLDGGGRAVLLAEHRAGACELAFHAGAYQGSGSFYDVIAVRFSITDPAEPYHVPLILSPFGYTTYRGG